MSINLHIVFLKVLLLMYTLLISTNAYSLTKNSTLTDEISCETFTKCLSDIEKKYNILISAKLTIQNNVAVHFYTENNAKKDVIALLKANNIKNYLLIFDYNKITVRTLNSENARSNFRAIESKHSNIKNVGIDSEDSNDYNEISNSKFNNISLEEIDKLLEEEKNNKNNSDSLTPNEIAILHQSQIDSREPIETLTSDQIEQLIDFQASNDHSPTDISAEDLVILSRDNN